MLVQHSGPAEHGISVLQPEGHSVLLLALVVLQFFSMYQPKPAFAFQVSACLPLMSQGEPGRFTITRLSFLKPWDAVEKDLCVPVWGLNSPKLHLLWFVSSHRKRTKGPRKKVLKTGFMFFKQQFNRLFG